MQLSVRLHRAVTSFATTTTLSPTVTMRSASEVDAAIEAACAGDSHGAQTPVSAISRGRGGRRRHPGPWTAAVLRAAPARAAECAQPHASAHGAFNLF